MVTFAVAPPSCPDCGAILIGRPDGVLVCEFCGWRHEPEPDEPPPKAA